MPPDIPSQEVDTLKLKRTRRWLHKVINRITLTALLLLLQFSWMAWTIVALAQYALWIQAVLYLVSAVIAVHIIRRDENPAYKIGWILLTCALPLFGGLVYFLFGNKHLSRRMRKKLQRVEDQQKSLGTLTQEPLTTAVSLPPRFRATARYLSDIAVAPAWNGTDVRYFALGDGLYPELLKDLKQARRYIFMEYFIIAKGEMLDGILDILREKAGEGVDVRIIYDDIGCEAAELYRFSQEMEQIGIRCLPFNPIIPLISTVMNHRDHRKITVIDGEIAYTGGINIADEYINRKERFGHWKDTGLRLRGEAVWNFTVMFLEMWNAFRPTEEDYTPFRSEVAPPPPTPEMPLMVQPYGDSPLDGENVGETVYLEILAQAEQYVYIFTPYLIIDSEMQTALCEAAKRGVDVRIVTPGIPDKKTAFHLTRSYYPVLLNAGVRIYEYTPGFIHAKSFVCDDQIGVVGTINMDYRSLYLHFECGTLFYGGQAVSDLRADAEATFAVSRPVAPKDLSRPRAFWRRLYDALLRALSPLF